RHLLEGARQVIARILAIATEPFAVGLDHPPRRVLQALPPRVLAGPAQQGAHGLLGLRLADGLLLLAHRGNLRWNAASVAAPASARPAGPCRHHQCKA